MGSIKSFTKPPQLCDNYARFSVTLANVVQESNQH